tara:strand:+ start:140 stop:337 length:198 start_codon:yes stop_codon:yes gene_type:complete
MNELLESIVNNFINGNITDCKEQIREYAKLNEDIYDLLSYYKSVTQLNKAGNDSFINIVYGALNN